MTDGWCSLRTRKEDQETGSSDWQGCIMVLEDLRAPAVWRNAQTHTFEWFGYTKQALFQNKFWLLVDHNCSFIFCKSDLTSGLWKYTKKLSWFRLKCDIFSSQWLILAKAVYNHLGWHFSLHTTLSFSITHSQQFYRRMALSIRSTLHVENELCPVWIVCGWTVQIKHVCVLQNKMHCYLVY